MRRSSGFTLLEMLVAIVLTGVVAVLVYGVVQAGLHSQERLTANRRAVQSARAMRILLQDALLNARPPFRRGRPMIALEHRLTPEGRPSDRLSFVTSGAGAPLTPDADWEVTVDVTAEGLTLVATPDGVPGASRVLAVLPGITSLQVRVLAPGRRSGWSEVWTASSEMPRGIELTLWGTTGAVGLPVRLLLPLGAGL